MRCLLHSGNALCILGQYWGADRAAYSALLFPLVALAISTVWEGYDWSVASLSGVFFIISGNFFILARKKLVRRVTPVLAGIFGISRETV